MHGPTTRNRYRFRVHHVTPGEILWLDVGATQG